MTRILRIVFLTITWRIFFRSFTALVFFHESHIPTVRTVHSTQEAHRWLETSVSRGKWVRGKVFPYTFYSLALEIRRYKVQKMNDLREEILTGENLLLAAFHLRRQYYHVVLKGKWNVKLLRHDRVALLIFYDRTEKIISYFRCNLFHSLNEIRICISFIDKLTVQLSFNYHLAFNYF